MNYEQLKEINSSLRSRNYFNGRYVSHIEITKIKDGVVFGVMYKQRQKNKQKYEDKTLVNCSIDELIQGLVNRSYYINNLSKIKNLIK